ncbi:hypothetical protein [uncultured Bacteroides sp.]|uniref:hypothetical protein n=1 Tax=uncultured Bacteroides sp. TaxID=162156 RepID=UPI002592D506|nr:hypothetical protein [uncultured Bacteroides sp.]
MKKDSHCKLSLPDEWQKEDFTAYIALENEEKNCHGTPSGQLSFHRSKVTEREYDTVLILSASQRLE